MSNEMGMHVVIYGNPRDGFEVVGPFKTGGDALRYGETERDQRDWWIMPLHAPAQEG